MPSSTPQTPSQLFAVDRLLDEEERAMQQTVRRFVDDRIRPHVAGWFEDGTIPARELARELGDLGVLGMHLEGYGCAGTSATAYGLACLELEAGDSGLRSLVSVQGSLAMFAIHRFGSEEQKQEWLPRLATGEAIGCFGLTEADFGSDPGGMRTRARRDGTDWVLDGSKLWITNGSVADVAVVWARTEESEGGRVRGFVVPTDTPGFSAPDGRPQALAARVGDLRARARGGPAARLGDAARGGGTHRPAVVPQRGPLRDRLRLAGRRPRLPRDRRWRTPSHARSSGVRWPASSSPRPSWPT